MNAIAETVAELLEAVREQPHAESERASRIAAAEHELRIAKKARDEADRWVITAEIALMKAEGVRSEIDRYRLAYREAALVSPEAEHAAWIRVMAWYWRQDHAHGDTAKGSPAIARAIEEEAARQEAEAAQSAEAGHA